MSSKHKAHALVVGGTRGIGRSLVRTLVEEGYVVSVIGRHAPSAVDRKLPHVHHWIVDLVDREQLIVALAGIVQQQGQLSALTFLQRYRGEGDTWEGELETSLTATKTIIERLQNEFDRTTGGAIVVVSSIASHFIADEQPLSYHVAKAALNQLVRYYALVLAPQGIRVNAVSPITVLKEESKSFYLQHEPLMTLYKRIIPMGRMGTADELADVVAFLSSAKASFITGQNLVFDGGLSLQAHEAFARKLAALDEVDVIRHPLERAR